MTDAGSQDMTGQDRSTADTARVVYILYLVGLAVGLTAVVGVVLAYMNRSDAAAWVRSHYDFQIKTFWLSIVWFIVGTLLTFVLIGWAVFLVWYIWVIARCVSGLNLLGKGMPHPDPRSSGFT
ncbi:MAG: DUF4870 family protein [Alphaproteobacteria bacterium]